MMQWLLKGNAVAILPLMVGVLIVAPAHGGPVPLNWFEGESLTFQTDDMGAHFDLHGAESFLASEVFDDGRDALEMTASLSGDAADGGLLRFRSGTEVGWGHAAHLTLDGTVSTSGWLELLAVSDEPGIRDGAFMAEILVDVAPLRRQHATYELVEVGDRIWIEASAAVTIQLMMDWGHGWAQGSMGEIELTFSGIPDPSSITLLAMGGLGTRRRRGS